MAHLVRLYPTLLFLWHLFTFSCSYVMALFIVRAFLHRYFYAVFSGYCFAFIRNLPFEQTSQLIVNFGCKDSLLACMLSYSMSSSSISRTFSILVRSSTHYLQ